MMINYKMSLVVILQLFCVGAALAQNNSSSGYTPGITFRPTGIPTYSSPLLDSTYKVNPLGGSHAGGLNGSFGSPFRPLSPKLNFGFETFKATSIYGTGLRSPFQRIDLKNIGDIKCIVKTDKALQDLTEVEDITDVNVCFQNKRSWQMPVEGEKLSDRELIESDKAVCECLRNKKEFTSYQEILNTKTPNLPNFSTENSFGNFERHVRIVKEKISTRHNMISLQASLIFNGNIRFAGEYASNLQPLEMRPLKSVVSLSEEKKTRDKKRSEERTELASKISAELVKFQGERPNPKMDLYTEKFPRAPDQCIGYREFINNTILPPTVDKDPDLFKGPFQPKDWNYKSLKNLYKTYLGMDQEERLKRNKEIELIKKKMLFLDKNPMVKNIIAASEHLPDFLKNESVPELDRTLVGNKFNALDSASNPPVKMINKIQNDLFSIMQDFSSKKDDAGKYRNRLSNFFTNDDIQNLNSLMTVIEDTSDRSFLETEEALLPPDMFKPENLTQELLEKEFMNSTGLRNPSDCKGRDAEIVACAETYAGYCRTIDMAVDTIRHRDNGHAPNSDTAILNDDDLSLEQLLETDISKNTAFRNMNEAMCNAPRKKIGDKRSNSPSKTFFQYKDEYCASRANASECALASAQDFEKIRSAYFSKYKDSVDPQKSKVSDSSVLDCIENNRNASVSSITSEDAENMFRPTPGGLFAEMRSRNPELFGPGAMVPNNATQKSVRFSGTAQVLSNLSAAMGGNNEADAQMGHQFNYSGAALGGGVQVPSQVAEIPRVENMPRSEREELLEDWKKEMEEWKEKKNSPDQAQVAAAAARELAAQAKIEALEQLLASQKKLTEDQYKLINDSIAAQTRNAESRVSEVDEEQNTPVNSNRRKTGNEIFSRNTDISDETQRSPASIQDSQQSTSGPGSSGGASARGRNGGANAVSDSRESVAREEAKLVNLRENSNGSITVTASSAGAAGASANAIVVPVSDALYASARSNPTGLNLSQIQQSIPAEQIARLQDKGDYFILLLQNGSNPPLEVRVKKENNVLVQVDGAPIVSRRVSLDTLNLILK